MTHSDQEIRFDLDNEAMSSLAFTSNEINGEISDDEEANKIDLHDRGTIQDTEPIACRDYLCEINIEFAQGGNQSNSVINRQSFKLKQLPYLVPFNVQHNFQNGSSINSRLSDESSCYELEDGGMERDNSDAQVSCYLNPNIDLDVSKVSCAFLGNSDFVPVNHLKQRRVILELISAKLSQPSTYNVATTNATGAILTPLTTNDQTSNLNNTNPGSSTRWRRTNSSFSGLNSIDGSSWDVTQIENNRLRNSNNRVFQPLPPKQAPSSPSAPIISSKRFVNYTLLIKTIPGLDKNPTVIERRFSDFSYLYHGLKSQERYSKMIENEVTFPKKVLMGNYTLANIAERSIEFSKLLEICMKNLELLWSGPFVSFLLDKELKEAHRISLVGDPDDVQSLIETVYHIERKVFFSYYSMDLPFNPKSKDSSITSINNDRLISSMSRGTSNGNSLINVENGSTNSKNISSDTSIENDINMRDSVRYSPRSPPEFMERTPSLIEDKMISPRALNKRIMVTFSLIFLTYYRGLCFQELRETFRSFSRLISSKLFMDNLASERYYSIFKACVSFLLEINQDDVIFDQDERYLLTQRLKYVEKIRPDPKILLASSITFKQDIESSSEGSSNNIKQNAAGDSHSVSNRPGRDLISLIGDRDFCSFLDERISLS